MAREYEIFKEKKWIFNDKGHCKNLAGYISYRNVICRALFERMNDENLDTLRADYFQPLLEHVQNRKNFLEKNDFLWLIFVRIDDKDNTEAKKDDDNPKADDQILKKDLTDPNVAFLVDKTKGCYPLMFGPDYKNTRLDALDEVIFDLERNWESIIGILKEFKKINSEWKEDIEDKLAKIYDFKTFRKSSSLIKNK